MKKQLFSTLVLLCIIQLSFAQLKLDLFTGAGTSTPIGSFRAKGIFGPDGFRTGTSTVIGGRVSGKSGFGLHFTVGKTNFEGNIASYSGQLKSEIMDNPFYALPVRNMAYMRESGKSMQLSLSQLGAGVSYEREFGSHAVGVSIMAQRNSIYYPFGSEENEPFVEEHNMDPNLGSFTYLTYDGFSAVNFVRFKSTTFYTGQLGLKYQYHLSKESRWFIFGEGTINHGVIQTQQITEVEDLLIPANNKSTEKTTNHSVTTLGFQLGINYRIKG